MGNRSAIAQQFITDEIGRALSRAGLPHNHVIRTTLDSEAEIQGTRGFAVRCNGESVSERIEQLRQDVKFAHTFPQPNPRVARTDMQSLSKNIDQISRGEVMVE